MSVALLLGLLALATHAQKSRPCGKYGGVLRTHAGEDLVNFDPHLQTTVRTQQRVGGSYNRLFRYSFYEKEKVLPDLVERWEVSNDGKTYTLTLRSGVRVSLWRPGARPPWGLTDLDATDVQWSLDKIRNKEFSRGLATLPPLIALSPSTP